MVVVVWRLAVDWRPAWFISAQLIVCELRNWRSIYPAKCVLPGKCRPSPSPSPSRVSPAVTRAGASQVSCSQVEDRIVALWVSRFVVVVVAQQHNECR